MITGRVRSVAVAVAALLAVAAACSSEVPDEVGGQSVPQSTVPDTLAPDTPAPDTQTPGATADGASIRAQRYCEVLLVTPVDAGLKAEVYSTFPLNDCPDEAWSAIDPAELAATAGVPLVVVNGPRFWAIDSVTRTTTDDIVSGEFGGLAMNRYATVVLADPGAVNERYAVRRIDRRAIMTFAAGSEVYVLVDPGGSQYVMQSWSQQVDADLSAGDLATLGQRLVMPEGWRFETRVPDEDLVIEFGDQPAEVIQDELLNTYSRIPG